MKSFIQTLKNIYKIEELRSRISFTLLIILIYRLGSKIVLPGVDPAQLESFSNRTSQGVLGLLDMFSGGAFSSASIFALGIYPISQRPLFSCLHRVPIFSV
jgi:preprotein translocase subunit SecY